MSRLSPTRFLASVRSVEEARLCVDAGADIIDCKDPDRGALGALPYDVVRAIKRQMPPDVPVSATIGDLIAEPAVLRTAVKAMAATGVDYVKVGFFPGGDAKASIEALGSLLLGTQLQLVGLLLADRNPDFALIAPMAAAGFSGVMVDTAAKDGGALPDVLSLADLRAFVTASTRVGLFAGLAGSLRLEHVPELLALKPNLLGFRGALCRAGDRRSVLDPDAIEAVREAIPEAARAQSMPQKVMS